MHSRAVRNQLVAIILSIRKCIFTADLSKCRTN